MGFFIYLQETFIVIVYVCFCHDIHVFTSANYMLLVGKQI